jgi:hypothetical protein
MLAGAVAIARLDSGSELTVFVDACRRRDRRAAADGARRSIPARARPRSRRTSAAQRRSCGGVAGLRWPAADVAPGGVRAAATPPWWPPPLNSASASTRRGATSIALDAGALPAWRPLPPAPWS